MARQQANLEYNQFKSGLITQGNLLNQPVDSFREGENFLLTKGNYWERRKGLDVELSGQFLPTYSDLSAENIVSSVAVWDTHVSAIPQIIVVQFGEKLRFFNSSVEPLSSGRIIVNNNEFLTTKGSTSDPISATSVDGLFVFATQDTDAVALQITDFFASESGAFELSVEQSNIDLQTRDFWGRNEPSKERPTAIDSDDNYDLRNQGWSAEKISAAQATLQVFPSDYDVWFLYKRTSSNEPNDIGKFDPTLMKDEERTGFGEGRQNTPAPKGSIVTNLRNLAEGYPSVVESYAGRVFYAGFNNTPRTYSDTRPDFGNFVFFSQLIKNNRDLRKCYQEADPTAEIDSDVVDTDGGFLKINSARNIKALVEVSSGLMVLADNGVWKISGTATGGSFSATGYNVQKVSDFGVLSRKSVVSYGDTVYYWANEGIITLSPDPTTGQHIAQNVTEFTIQDLYNEITTSNKQNSVGVVEREDKYIRWLFSDGANPNLYDREIVLDLQVGAFFLNVFKRSADVAEQVFGYVPERITVDNVISRDYTVVVGTDTVLAGGDPVVVGLGRVEGDESYKKTKYLVGRLADDQMSFYQYNNDEFKDFGIVDAEAYMISSPQKLDDTQRKKSIKTLAVHMLRTDTFFVDEFEGSVVTRLNESALINRVRWNFADQEISGQWSRPKQMYRYRRPLILKPGVNVYPYEVITARERVRGSGVAFQFEFRTEPEKDCKLLGWATTVTGGSNV